MRGVQCSAQQPPRAAQKDTQGSAGTQCDGFGPAESPSASVTSATEPPGWRKADGLCAPHHGISLYWALCSLGFVTGMG